MITAALTGNLDNVIFEKLPIFDLLFPIACEGVPTELLNPRNTWVDKSAYDATANNLASKFVKNFEKFAAETNAEILAAAPKVLA
jgi:phosphoenolpyruvate carboxykinase (ATP)